MKRNILTAITIVACCFLIFNGIYLFNSLKDKSKTVKSNTEYIKMLADPTNKADGTSYIGMTFKDFKLKNIDNNEFILSKNSSLFKLILVFSEPFVESPAACRVG